MSKNLCPVNDLTFENSQTIRFETDIPAGEYTISAIVESTDTDSSVCLMLFYYVDGTTKEVYISRSLLGDNRVSKTATFSIDVNRVRIYASEGYNPSVGDTATFSKLMIEAGGRMTDYVPYGEEPEYNLAELCLYFAAMAHQMPIAVCPKPTCRLSHLLRRYLNPDYQLPFIWVSESSYAERYVMDLIYGTPQMLSHIPQSDMEKYLHCMIGGTVDEMPDPGASVLNYWMNEALEAMKK